MNKNTAIKHDTDHTLPVYSVKPIADVYETDTGYNFEVEMPGIDKENLDIDFHDGVLTVKGHREESTKHTQRNLRFERRFSLGVNVKADDISAKLENAVLNITVPKATTPPPKQINVA